MTAPKSRMPDLVDCVIEDQRWQVLKIENLAEIACRATLKRRGIGPDGYEIALLACDDSRIAALNADFRDKPQPTNVLSWPDIDLARQAGAHPELPPKPEGPFVQSLGDIAIAFETCQGEAKAAGKPMAQHVTHLIVHGCLHLLGYDHVLDTDAARMEGLETEILESLGQPDPY